MKTLCKTIGYIIAIGGVISSFVMANIYGKTTSVSYWGNISSKRNWGLTIAVFLGVLATAFVESVIFFAIGHIIENQESMKYELARLEGNNGSALGYNGVKYDDNSRALQFGEWRCKKCGKIHPPYETSCPICKESKP